MRVAGACLIVVIVAASAEASPLATLAADVDGDGTIDHVELGGDGTLRIATKTGATTTSLGAISRATLAAGLVKGTPMIVVAATTAAGDEAIVLELAGASWKVLVREPVGGVGLDHDYGVTIGLTPIGVFRYQTRPGYHRCDGKPAYLFAEGFIANKFHRLARIPTDVAEGAPSIAAHPDTAAATRPVIYQARIASHEPGAGDAGALGIPSELDDGNSATYWHEEFSASDGEGQFFTFEPRFGSAKAAQLRVVPGNPTTATTFKQSNRPRRLAVVSAQSAWHVDLPDATNDPIGTAYVADLPTPLEGCVTVVLESTYGPSNGTTAIAELEVFGAGERGGGGEAILVDVIARGADGMKAATQELARQPAAGVAAIDTRLAQSSDASTRARLIRALVELRDPSAGPILARAATQGWVHDRDLLEVIGAIGGLGQAQELHDLAVETGLPLAARIAAVRALGPASEQERAALVDLAGNGPRELRRAVIDVLAGVTATALVQAAQAATSPTTAGDLWRSATRRAHAVSSERPAALAAMIAALAGASDYERRYRLIDGIASIGDGPVLHQLGQLLHGLPAGPETAAFDQVVVGAIAANPRPEAFELLVGFARDADPGVRLASLGALATADGGAAGPWHAPDGPEGIDRVLVTALSTDTWPEVRRHAAQLLGERCARTGAARALGDAVARDPEVDVRGDALAALVECKAAGTAELLARTWDDAKAPIELRQRAIDLTVAFGDRGLATKLVAKLASWRGAAISSGEALALAQNAAYALGRLAPPGAGDALLDALEDSSFPEIVAAAASGLGLLGPACPAPAKARLKTLAHSDEQQIQTAAARATAQCGK